MSNKTSILSMICIETIYKVLMANKLLICKTEEIDNEWKVVFIQITESNFNSSSMFSNKGKNLKIHKFEYGSIKNWNT